MPFWYTTNQVTLLHDTSMIYFAESHCLQKPDWFIHFLQMLPFSLSPLKTLVAIKKKIVKKQVNVYKKVIIY